MAGLAVATVVAGCSDGAVTVVPSTPSGQVAEHCAHLGNALPQQIESLRPRVITPRSPLVHAWGNPAIVLTCGTTRPVGYSPTSSETTAVDNLRWFQQQPDTKTVIWTAIVSADVPGKVIYVSLMVPTHYEDQGVFLVDLVKPLTTALTAP